ncbi:MAG TPA: hypothetical protein VHI52_22895 [Verrucomicrobiae bacterium]|nr:hypothetical protein [Verrucomicrobiae bacterium]
MPQKPPGEQITFRGTFNFLYVICLVHSRMVTPFLRGNIGECAQGIPTAVAGACLVYFGYAIEDQMVLDFFGAWLCGVMAQRWTRPKDRLIHSAFEGRPVMAMLLCPFVKDELLAKRWVEPLICVGAGFALLSWSDTVGKIVMSAGFSLRFLELIDQSVNEKREREIIDARLESEYYARGVREKLNRKLP